MLKRWLKNFFVKQIVTWLHSYLWLSNTSWYISKVPWISRRILLWKSWRRTWARCEILLKS